MSKREITRTEQDDSIRWTLTVNGERAAFLDAHRSGLILNIETANGFARQGLATALYRHADAEISLYHVPAWGRTAEGSIFAEAVGGETMDDAQAAAILGVDLASDDEDEDPYAMPAYTFGE